MSDLVVLLRIWLVRIGYAAGRLRPHRWRVLLATAHADQLGGNLAAIHDGIVRWAPRTQILTVAHRPKPGIRGRLAAARHAVQAGYRLATSRLVVIDDYYFPAYVVTPRPGTRIVQTWHASGAFKKFGNSVVDKTFGASDALLRRVRIHANYDLCLVGSQRSAPFFAEAFGQPLERVTSGLGIPRTDPFFDAAWRATQADAVRHRYGIPGGKAVLLYAPTFRGDEVHRARHDEVLDLALLQRELGADHVLLLRLHPFVRSTASIDPALAGFVIDASDHPDIHALMLVSDHLITDYSSAIFEWALLERPMSFFAPDLDAYEKERGFYVDYRSWVPGPVFEETPTLARHLRAGDFDLDVVRRFRQESFEVADGHATRRFVDEVVTPAMEGRP